MSKLLTSIPRPYRFHVAVACAGKPRTARERRQSTPFQKNSPIGQWRDQMLKGKARDAGEDFFFFTQMRNGSGLALGIADGVGGWVLSGVDPSLFSQALMYHAYRYSSAGWAGEPEVDPTLDYAEREQIEGWELTPMAAMEMAYGGVLRERDVTAGSSTACILTLNSSSGLLRAANLGDSGFTVIRSSSLLYKQPPQTHFFNCPKQLTKMPTDHHKRFPRACDDSPSEAETYQLKLRDGDLVIIYTDGLSDNVFQSEILNISSLVGRSSGSDDQQVQTLADRLVEYARDCMSQRNRPSPFERAAARQGMYFQGGKVDDVTVTVALVREAV